MRFNRNAYVLFPSLASYSMETEKSAAAEKRFCHVIPSRGKSINENPYSSKCNKNPLSLIFKVLMNSNIHPYEKFMNRWKFYLSSIKNVIQSKMDFSRNLLYILNSDESSLLYQSF